MASCRYARLTLELAAFSQGDTLSAAQNKLLWLVGEGMACTLCRLGRLACLASTLLVRQGALSCKVSLRMRVQMCWLVESHAAGWKASPTRKPRYGVHVVYVLAE